LDSFLRKENDVPKTIAELRREIQAKERQLGKLETQRRKLARQLDAIDRQIAGLVGKKAPSKKAPRKKVAGKARRAARKGPSLSNVLAAVLKGKGNTKVADAAKMALAAGYKSASDQFANIVSQTLSGDRRFRKVSRGVYALKGAAAAVAAKKAPKKTAKRAKRAKRAPRTGSLKAVLVQVMGRQKSMTVGEAMAAALAAGYKTTSKNFRLLVNQTLLKDPQFRKVGRGAYAVKA
jgi:chromosome segregation ATPase